MLYNPRWEETKSISKVLLAAADYMERHGHCPNFSEDPEGRVCIFGAIAKVSTAPVDIDQLRVLLGGSIVHYNETHTGPEIVAKLRDIAHV